jgi:hypothetical protein
VIEGLTQERSEAVETWLSDRNNVSEATPANCCVCESEERGVCVRAKRGVAAAVAVAGGRMTANIFLLKTLRGKSRSIT